MKCKWSKYFYTKTAAKNCYTIITLSKLVHNNVLTFASGDVAVFFLDVFVCSEAPRLGVGGREYNWVAAVIGDVLNNGFMIRRVIDEILDIIIRMQVRQLTVPPLTRYSRYSVTQMTHVLFTRRCS